MAPQDHPVSLNSWLHQPQPPRQASSDSVGPAAAPASDPPPATAPPRLPKRRDELSLPAPAIPEVPQAMEAAPSLFEMGPGGSAVAALVRVRPFSKKEKRSGAPAAVVVTDEQGERSEHVERSVRVNGCGLKGSNLQFGFDRVAGGKVDQQQFWDSCGIQQMLDAAMEGFGATVFAYGQTGSGKTHTMLGPAGGSAGVDGLIPRAIDYLYTRAQEHSATDPNVTYSLRGSFYEIYNEQVHDLLNPQQLLDADGNATPVNLQVRWNPATESFFVEDLFVVGCDSAEDMTAVLCEGTANRRMGNHAMNKDSSRSHSVFTIEVDVDLGDGAPVRKGKVCLVDLAGSERQKHTHSEGERLKEANSINTSLLVLGKVISALSAAATEAHPPRPPFRDSKLTMVLKDSLGGRSLALMIACVSPSSTYSDESVSTLWYASRAKNIVNRPSVRHGDPKDHQIAALQAEVAGLRHENSLLKQACTSAGVVVPGPDGTDIASKPWQGAADGKDGGAGFLPHIASGGADGKGWRASANKGGPGNPQQLAALQAEIARLGSEVASLRTEKDAAVEAQRSMMQQLGHAGALSGQLDSLGQMNAQLQGQAQGLVQVNGGLRRSLQDAHNSMLFLGKRERGTLNRSKEAREVQNLRKSNAQMQRRLRQQQKQARRQSAPPKTSSQREQQREQPKPMPHTQRDRPQPQTQPQPQARPRSLPQPQTQTRPLPQPQQQPQQQPQMAQQMQMAQQPTMVVQVQQPRLTGHSKQHRYGAQSVAASGDW